MRISAIPAQITTIEDRIVGNLNINQILLMVMPIFISIFIYFVVPPISKISTFKVCIVIVIASVALILSIRIKDRLVISWIVLRLRYRLRPRVYLATICEASHLSQEPIANLGRTEATEWRHNSNIRKQHFSAEAILEKYSAKATNQISFSINKKGELSAIISFIK